MSDRTPTHQHALPPTLITLTLPTPVNGGLPLEQAIATLLIQRGELAHLRQFTYVLMDDLTTAIQDAYTALAAVEAAPPVMPEPPKTAPKSVPKTKVQAQPSPAIDEEPTIDIPLKKGTVAVKINYLKIVGGETDAAAYRQAVLMAGKLIDGQLWDGQSPIRIDDVYAVQRKLKHLSDSEMSLFILEDFVQRASLADIPESVQDANQAVEDIDNEHLPLMNTRNATPFSTNGHHSDDDATD